MSAMKCVVVGDSDVGKTSMLSRFCRQVFPEDHIPTVFDDYTATVTVGDTTEQSVLNLFDTTGQSEYNRLRVITYPGTKVIIVCFSVVRPRSLDSVFDRWLPELVSYCGETIPVVLVGTQTDLRASITSSMSSVVTSSVTQLLPDNVAGRRHTRKSDIDIITTKQGLKAARRIGADYYVECSALDGTGLAEVFSRAAAAGRSNVVDRLSSPSSLASWRMKRRQRVLDRVIGRSSRSTTTASDLLTSLMHCWQRQKTFY